MEAEDADDCKQLTAIRECLARFATMQKQIDDTNLLLSQETSKCESLQEQVAEKDRLLCQEKSKRESMKVLAITHTYMCIHVLYPVVFYLMRAFFLY
jgi:hypothetical protein